MNSSTFFHLPTNFNPKREDYAQTSPSTESPLLDRQQFLLEINPADRGFASRAVDLFGLETVVLDGC